MNQLTILEIEFEYGNQKKVIYPVIMQDDENMILVDCGYPDFLPLIQEAAALKRIDLNKLTKVVITHHDYDHMGSLAQIKNKYPRIDILSSSEEANYISGKEKSLRLQQAENIYETLPEIEKKSAKEFEAYLALVEPAKVGGILSDKDFYAWCGGIEIVATPGHTKGHLSLYLKEDKTLIAGDALVIEGGELKIPFPQYAYDIWQAKESIKKLIDYDINKIICYHGGVYTKPVKASLIKILDTLA